MFLYIIFLFPKFLNSNPRKHVYCIYRLQNGKLKVLFNDTLLTFQHRGLIWDIVIRNKTTAKTLKPFVRAQCTLKSRKMAENVQKNNFCTTEYLPGVHTANVCNLYKKH